MCVFTSPGVLSARRSLSSISRRASPIATNLSLVYLEISISSSVLKVSFARYRLLVDRVFSFDYVISLPVETAVSHHN